MSFDLREFVNRESGIAAFKKLLGDRRRRILLLHGPEGIGKTWLLKRLQQISQDEGYAGVLINLADSRLTAEEPLIRTLSARLGPSFADRFEQVAAGGDADLQPENGRAYRSRSSGGVTIGDVGGDLVIEGDLVGGDKVTITNSLFVVNTTNEQMIAPALSRALRQTVIDFLQSQKLILFFDHLTRLRGQQATVPVASWLRDELLAWQFDQPETFANLWLVFAGRLPPFGNEIDRWQRVADTFIVRPFEPAVIEKFWVQVRRLDPSHLQGLIPASGGNPGLLTMMADNYESSAGGETA